MTLFSRSSGAPPSTPPTSKGNVALQLQISHYGAVVRHFLWCQHGTHKSEAGCTRHDLDPWQKRSVSSGQMQWRVDHIYILCLFILIVSSRTFGNTTPAESTVVSFDVLRHGRHKGGSHNVVPGLAHHFSWRP